MDEKYVKYIEVSLPNGNEAALKSSYILYMNQDISTNAVTMRLQAENDPFVLLYTTIRQEDFLSIRAEQNIDCEFIDFFTFFNTLIAASQKNNDSITMKIIDKEPGKKILQFVNKYHMNIKDIVMFQLTFVDGNEEMKRENALQIIATLENKLKIMTDDFKKWCDLRLEEEIDFKHLKRQVEEDMIRLRSEHNDLEQYTDERVKKYYASCDEMIERFKENLKTQHPKVLHSVDELRAEKELMEGILERTKCALKAEQSAKERGLKEIRQLLRVIADMKETHELAQCNLVKEKQVLQEKLANFHNDSRKEHSEYIQSLKQSYNLMKDKEEEIDRLNRWNTDLSAENVKFNKKLEMMSKEIRLLRGEVTKKDASIEEFKSQCKKSEESLNWLQQRKFEDQAKINQLVLSNRRLEENLNKKLFEVKALKEKNQSYLSAIQEKEEKAKDLEGQLLKQSEEKTNKENKENNIEDYYTQMFMLSGDTKNVDRTKNPVRSTDLAISNQKHLL